MVLSACGFGNENNEVEADKKQDTATKNVTKEGFPVVKETEKMTFFANKGPINDPHDWNDLFIWNEYEDMTNIDIEWIEVASDSVKEKRNLSLVQDDLPDVYYYAGFPSADIYKYGKQGVFV